MRDNLNCELRRQQHTPQYLGLVYVDWETGFCQEGYVCRDCGLKAQKPTFFAPEAIKGMRLYPDAIEIKLIDGRFCQRRAKGEWRVIK